MNRTTVAFLALAILLTHTLGIHQSPDGDFAWPYEVAHVAYRLGRNWVHQGSAVWDVQSTAAESYPSPLWIAVSAAAELVRAFPTTVTQALGILSALTTIVVLAQFSPQRMAGLIAPVLLATSGSVAAAAASGTEAATTMALVTIGFLAFERGWRAPFALTLVLALTARPEVVVLLLLLAVFERFDRPLDASDAPRRSLGRAFWPPFAVLILAVGARRLWLGTWVSPVAAAIGELDGARALLGLRYLASFVLASGSGPLLLLPLVFTLFGRLRGTGHRALLLFLAWAAVVALSGGDGLPFWNALTPTLPLAFLAIQVSITEWLDRLPRHALVASTIVTLTMGASLLTSKLPGDLGPVPLERLLTRWMRPQGGTEDAFPHDLARAGLLEEIRDVGHLRNAGLFLKDMIREDARILTFWPGSIGYLSRKHVIDLLGRTQPAPGAERAQSWRGQPKVDLIADLAQPAEYLVPAINPSAPITITERLHGWLRRYDVVGDTPQRFAELLAVLRRFELVSVPVPEDSADPRVLSPEPYLILRDRSLGLAPTLILRETGRAFEVRVQHLGHRQVADLLLEFTAEDGTSWRMAPTGEWRRRAEVRARAGMLIFDTGDLPFRLAHGSPPPGAGAGTLTARLLAPGISEKEPFAAVAKPVSVRFP